MSNAMAKFFQSFGLVIFLSLVPLRGAYSFDGNFPNCDKIISDWILENIGSAPKSIDYVFEPEPSPGRYSTAIVVPFGCDGKVTFELMATSMRCKRPEGTSGPSIIKNFRVSDGCR
jgi:hypothetical protein